MQKREKIPSRPHDRTIHINRPISTKLKDLDRGHTKAGRAKYAYFSRFLSTGLFLACVGFGLGTPLDSVYARAYFDLATKSNKVSAPSVRSEPQNSQNFDFGLSQNFATGGGDITMDDKAFSSEVGPSGTWADVISNDHQGKVSLYIVRQGDTIAQIAKTFGVTVNTILWANDLARGANLRDGQYLVILPIDGVQHIVKKGDTLKSIAKKYEGDIAEIMEFNDIAPGQALLIGGVVIVPDGKESPTSTPGNTSGGRSRIIAAYPSYDGYYTHPVPAGHKTQGIHGYNGVDYGAPIGTPVYAAAEGTVIVSRFSAGYCGRSCGGGYGNYIVIEHPNGTQTLYGHLSAVYTKVGVRVDKGQWIGEVGNSGKSTGSHLHFEVRGAKNPF